MAENPLAKVISRKDLKTKAQSQAMADTYSRLALSKIPKKGARNA